MIPKIIHYCWFGRNEKSKLICDCIESWKKYCPDYKFIEWNEINFDLESVPYVKEAYDRKKWAFVSDYVRLYAVYNFGGIYLDTDVKLLQSIENLRKEKAWFAFESTIAVNTGLGFGAEKENNDIKKMMEFYEQNHYIVDGKEEIVACTQVNTDVLQMKHGFTKNGKMQTVEGILVLSEDEYSKYAVHYGEMSWVEGIKPRRKKYRKNSKIKNMLRRAECIQFMKKIGGGAVGKMLHILCV